MCIIYVSINMSDYLLFDCEIETDSKCKKKSFNRNYQRPTDPLLQVLQSVLRKIYVAEAILFKQLESSSTTQETEQLQMGLMKLSEVEKRINLRILGCVHPISPYDSEEE
ncbi:hypothetical protein DICVIV_01499 [Dictyocaulus viviparus]|uniref:Uncharacterized protein n=1 Tax=Dictyocaulus viviparus TaxID=29172 RepID=A0A0D8Y7Y3_DICVI|nr:hypothetical protein DICVIV_01499 [Dictyocaulus viviparus]